MRRLTCEKHIEEALDDAVFEDNAMPVMSSCLPVHNSGVKCDYCEESPIYIVENMYSNTK